MKFEKYKQNLSIVEHSDGFAYVKSYDTLVAKIEMGVALH